MDKFHIEYWMDEFNEWCYSSLFKHLNGSYESGFDLYQRAIKDQASNFCRPSSRYRVVSNNLHNGIYYFGFYFQSPISQMVT